MTLYLGLRYGLGKHVSQVSESDAKNFLIVCQLSFLKVRRLTKSKVLYVLELGYVSTLPIVKISVLLFYYRIFPQKPFRWAMYGVGGFLFLFLLSSWLGVVLQCLPIRSMWQPNIPHRCVDQVKYYVAQGSLNFVSDVVVVLMPVPLLLKLQLPMQKRLRLVVVFLLGGL